MGTGNVGASLRFAVDGSKAVFRVFSARVKKQSEQVHLSR